MTFMPVQVKGVHSAVEHVEEHIEKVTNEIDNSPGWALTPFGASDEYSTHVISLQIERNFLFYVLQLAFPLLVVLGIQWMGFLSRGLPLLDYIVIGVSALFVFLGVKFSINLDLPHIAYMTLIDYFFNLTYCFIALIVALQVRLYFLDLRSPAAGDHLHKRCRWLLPTLFFLLTTLLVVLVLMN